MSIEFNKPSQRDIESHIQKELKDKPFESLYAKKQDGVQVKPIYTSLDGHSVSTPSLIPYRINFQYFLCPSSQKEELNVELLHALENGASGLILDLNNDEYRVEDFQVLLKDVMLEYIHIEFQNLRSFKSLSEFLKSYSKTVSAAHIAFENATEYSSILTIPNDNFIENASKLLHSAQIGLKPHYIHVELSGDFFWDVCKIRAFKILLVNILKKENNSNSFLIIGETPISNKSKDKAENNLLKLTTETMSAMIAGCEGVWIKPFDFETVKSNQFSQRISQNIFNILNEESYLNYVDDPSQGSYYIENYTRQIAEKLHSNLR